MKFLVINVFNHHRFFDSKADLFDYFDSLSDHVVGTFKIYEVEKEFQMEKEADILLLKAKE